MSGHIQTHSELPHVDAALNYLAPMRERVRNYAYEPPPGVPRSNTAPEAHIVPIYDARPVASEITLDREGFALLESGTGVGDFWDDEEIRHIYQPEAEAMIAAATGASRVVIFDHTRRKRVPGADDRTAGTPRRWFYVPEMQPNEAILIKCYDSAPDKARFTAHSAFEDPTAPADVLPRESIELRTLVFHV